MYFTYLLVIVFNYAHSKEMPKFFRVCSLKMHGYSCNCMNIGGGLFCTVVYESKAKQSNRLTMNTDLQPNFHKSWKEEFVVNKATA